jgi:hypothetical protein
MKNVWALCLVLLSTSLVACTGQTNVIDKVQTARDLKFLLDERQIACDDFDVFSTGADSEVLACLDGTASQKSFRFLIWRSLDLRDAGLEGFCYELNRNGNASSELIIQDTWLAFSESDFFPASSLADELDASIVSGQDFCASRGLEVAPAYSDLEIADCESDTLTLRTLVGNENLESLVNFRVGSKFSLWFEVQNEGPVDCILGGQYQSPVFSISRGSRIVWTSSDCSSEVVQEPIEILKSNEKWTSSPRIWEFNSSSSAGCELESNSTLPGDGRDYQVKVEVNGHVSEPTLFYVF